MRKIDWELNDGFPLDQGSMKFMQDGLLDVMMAYINYWQHSINSSFFIISGMEHNATTNQISAGWCFMGGNVLEYTGGAYPGNGCVVRPVITETEVEYEDGVDRPALKKYTATVMLGGTGAGFLYQLAPRVPKIQALTWANILNKPTGLVIDPNYVHTDNNFTNTLLAKLNGIQAGAEQNVQSDWNETNPNSDAFIRNKPNWFRPVVEGVVEVVFAPANNTAVATQTTGQILSANATNLSDYHTVVTVTFPETQNFMIHMNQFSFGQTSWDANVTSQLVWDSVTNNSFQFIVKKDEFGLGGLFKLKFEIKLLAL